MTRQVNTWAKQWDRVKTRELPDVGRLHSALADAIPPTSAASIVHGDFRIDNTILDSDDVTIVRAVVDWEMSTLGDPLHRRRIDVRLPRTRLRSRPRSQRGMDQPTPSHPGCACTDVHGIPGRDLTGWSFYLALAYFKPV